MKGRVKSPVISKPTSLGSEVKSGAGGSSSSSATSRPLFEVEKGREEKERRKKEKTETEDSPLPSSPLSEHEQDEQDDSEFPRSEIKEGEVASKCVWVGNVSPEINEAQFRKYFDSFGDIDLIRMFPRSKCAFVTFKKAESAMKSLTLEGKLVGSMCLTLNIGKASRHLWVGNIGSNVTELDLRTAFEEYGTVESVRVLRGNKCAFVNFASEAEALVALENMNGKLLGFQRIVINFQWENSFKRPGRQRTQGTKGGTSRYPPGISKTFEIPSRQLFVGSIVPSVTDGTLWHLFSRFGEVEQIKGYANRGYAFIVFRSLQVAIWVREQMKLYPPTIGGRALIVNFGRQPTTNPAGDDYSSYPIPSQTSVHVSAPVLSTSQPMTTTGPGTTPVSLPPQFSYAHASIPGGYVVALPQASTSATSSDGLLAAPVSYTHGSSPSMSSISPTRTLESLESELRSLTLGTPYSGAIDPTSSPSLTALTQNLVPLHLLQTHQTSEMPSTSPRGAVTTSSPYFDSSYLSSHAGLTGFGLLGLGNQTGGAPGVSQLSRAELLASLGSYTATSPDSILQLSQLPPGISSVTSSRSVSPSHDTPTAAKTTFKEFPAKS